MTDARSATADGIANEALRSALTSRVALATVATSLAASIVVAGNRAGLGLALVCVAALAVAALGSEVRQDRWRLALLGCAAVLAAVPVFRDAAWLVTLDLLVALVLAAFALAGPGALAAPVQTVLAVMGGTIAGPVAVVKALFNRLPAPAPGALPVVVRAGLLSLGLVTVFTALFTSADPAFAEVFSNVSPDLDHLDVRIGVALLTLLATSALALVAATRQKAPAPSEPRRRITPVEWGSALGALAVLFAVFVGVQFVVLFGGNDHVLETAGLTYADYAHEGFGQLLVVAILVLALTGGAMRFAQTGSERQRRALHGLLALLAGLTLVVLASALYRLDLYVDAFGATRLRVVAVTTCVWIGAVLVATTLSLFTRRRGWLRPAIALLTAASAIAVTVANPDALIARRNVDRFEQTGKFDADYNAKLSSDATPELVGVEDLPDRAFIIASQAAHTGAEDDFWELNASRSEARDALLSID